MSSPWVVYILQCADNSLYTGITTDVDRRIAEHNGSARGAKYTRSRQPVKLVWCQNCASRSEASKLEAKIKKKPRLAKLRLITSHLIDLPT